MLAQMAMFPKNDLIIYGLSVSVKHPVISWSGYTKANKGGSSLKWSEEEPWSTHLLLCHIRTLLLLHLSFHSLFLYLRDHAQTQAPARYCCSMVSLCIQIRKIFSVQLSLFQGITYLSNIPVNGRTF